MKRGIALLLALLLCLSLLAGCGNSAQSERRDKAKELFGVSDSEYEKNSEYYDALIDVAEEYTGLFGQSDTAWETDETDSPADGSGAEDPLVLNGVSLEEAYERLGNYEYGDDLAVKQGDRYYALDHRNENVPDSFYDAHGFLCSIVGLHPQKPCYYRLITDTTWEYPAFSQSAGDQFVEFSKYNGFHHYHLTPVEKLYTALPLVYSECEEEYALKYDYRRESMISADETAMRYASAEVNTEEIVCYGSTRGENEIKIDGVPIKESPRLFLIREIDGRRYYGVKGEPDEVLTVSYKEYGQYYERRLYCNAEFLLKGEDEDRILLEPGPTVDGLYSPLSREGGGSIPPGLYEIDGFLVQIVD